MSESITTFCDICNQGQDRNQTGRGYCDCPEEDAIANFDWIRNKEGSIVCLDCQYEIVDSDIVLSPSGVEEKE